MSAINVLFTMLQFRMAYNNKSINCLQHVYNKRKRHPKLQLPLFQILMRILHVHKNLHAINHFRQPFLTLTDYVLLSRDKGTYLWQCFMIEHVECIIGNSIKIVLKTHIFGMSLLSNQTHYSNPSPKNYFIILGVELK